MLMYKLKTELDEKHKIETECRNKTFVYIDVFLMSLLVQVDGMVVRGYVFSHIVVPLRMWCDVCKRSSKYSETAIWAVKIA